MRLLPLDQSYGTPTTRRHPRTLNDAFPGTPEYATAISHQPSSASWLLADLAIAAILICVVAAVLFGALA